MMNREYIYIRRSRIDFSQKFIILISKSIPNAATIKESEENVRVYDYFSQMVIKPDESFHKPGFKFMLTYFDDPRASFPTPAYAWMAARGVPDFVEKLHQAALKLSQEKLREHWQNEEEEEENENVPFETPHEDEITDFNKMENMEVWKKFLSRLPEPTIHYDSLIWN